MNWKKHHRKKSLLVAIKIFPFQFPTVIFLCSGVSLSWRDSYSNGEQRLRENVRLLCSLDHSDIARTMSTRCMHQSCAYEGGLGNCQIRCNPFLSRCLMSVTNSLVTTQANLCREQSLTKRLNKFCTWMQKILTLQRPHRSLFQKEKSTHNSLRILAWCVIFNAGFGLYSNA
jgi:hypothetical protein